MSLLGLAPYFKVNNANDGDWYVKSGTRRAQR